jgi:K+-sensing histidine kinase KdpD
MNIDEVYFRQVISNIVGNAVKFTPDKGIISVQFTSEGDHFMISINDSGPGMNEDTIEKIFSDLPVRSTTGTNGEKGTGLGLKICNKIISNHGFEMKILPSASQGTTIGILIKNEDILIN